MPRSFSRRVAGIFQSAGPAPWGNVNVAGNLEQPEADAFSDEPVLLLVGMRLKDDHFPHVNEGYCRK